MRITNSSGQYWTGTCFGVEQNAMEYRIVEDMPDEIDVGGMTLRCSIYPNGDARYHYQHEIDARAWSE